MHDMYFLIQLKEVAMSYGFTKAVTCDELHTSLPHLYPDLQPPMVESALDDTAQQHLMKEGFGAVLAFTDPITWGRELQIVTDVISAPNGDIHHVSKGGGLSDTFVQHVPVYNACADFTYAAKWPVARFGAGAFRVSLEKLWEELSNDSLEQTLYGKPYLSQYRFVEEMLSTSSVLQGKADEDSSTSLSIDRFYMVGDNPVTDIRGARSAGPHWHGVLTRSGLWKGAKSENDPTDPAHAVVDDVLEGVHWILRQEAQYEQQ